MQELIIIPMFPYTSGNLHIGHVRVYAIANFIFKTLKFFNKLTNIIYATGWDAFGLPAENAALIYQLHPQKWTQDNIKEMKRQFHLLKFDFDWTREISTCSTQFIKITQEIFSILFKGNLVCRRFGLVNWDEKDQTVLSNEQVKNNRGWRSDQEICKKFMQQWFIQIDNDLAIQLDQTEHLKWPKGIRDFQKDWIGIENTTFYTHYTENLHFIVEATEDHMYCAISIAHPLAVKILGENYKIPIEWFQKENNEQTITISTCTLENNLKLDIKISNQIDNERYGKMFLNKANLEEMQPYLFKKVTHKMKDWLVSRQRLWGTPIPICYCSFCGTQLIHQDDLARFNGAKLAYKDYKTLVLDIKDAKLTAKCSKCSSDAEPEPDSLDTFFDSSWYFLAFLNKDAASIKDLLYHPALKNKNFIVDEYIGGAEHARSHLLYARIIIKLLNRFYQLSFNEPFHQLTCQGFVLKMSYQKDGQYVKESIDGAKPYMVEKMSKSKFNIIDPLELTQTYGADVIKLSILSDFPIAKDYIFEHKICGIAQGLFTKLANIFKTIDILEISEIPKLPTAVLDLCHKGISYWQQYQPNKLISILYSLLPYQTLKGAKLLLLLLSYPLISDLHEEVCKSANISLEQLRQVFTEVTKITKDIKYTFLYEGKIILQKHFNRLLEQKEILNLIEELQLNYKETIINTRLNEILVIIVK